EVDDQVDDDIDEAEQQHDALDHRIVAAQYGIDGEASDARDREHSLGNDGAPDQQRHADADHSDDRRGGGLERGDEQAAALADALGAGGADIVLLQRLQHGGAGGTGDQRDVDAAEGERWQDQVFNPRRNAFRERRVTLHRQPIELQREH